jgi:hypothetical protein
MYAAKIFFTGLILFLSGIQVEITELPDPFLMNNGSRVGSMGDWKIRRNELKEIVQLYEYGHFADVSPVTITKISDDSVIRGKNGNLYKRVVDLKTGNDGSKTFTINLFIPFKGEGPFPVIVVGDLCWGSLQKRLTPDGLASLANRGYIIAEFDRTKFSPDKNTRNNLSEQNFDTGAIVEWAWGYQRAIDYLITLKIIDKSKIAVTGWSRGGKAALLAGAFDDRIALVAPNCSGTSGSGPLRYIDSGAEKLDDIVTRFPYWFCSNLSKYKGEQTNMLPFDQHSLISLVAPRAYLSTNGLNDKWANPLGTAQAHLAAKEVFAALGVQDRIGIFYINSGHDHNIDKWVALLDFADKIFFGKPTTYDYNSIPFPDIKKAYSWSAPILK